jgi:hypothetical protein
VRCYGRRPDGNVVAAAGWSRRRRDVAPGAKGVPQVSFHAARPDMVAGHPVLQAPFLKELVPDRAGALGHRFGFRGAG